MPLRLLFHPTDANLSNAFSSSTIDCQSYTSEESGVFFVCVRVCENRRISKHVEGLDHVGQENPFEPGNGFGCNVIVKLYRLFIAVEQEEFVGPVGNKEVKCGKSIQNGHSR